MKTFALVGTPNAGKTALFNRMTRSHQRVANYSGVTVEAVKATFDLGKDGTAELIDLPGAYSLRPFTDEERLLPRALKEKNLSGVIVVIDATQLERGIRFVLELIDFTDLPMVVALNMTDLAEKRGILIDEKKLSDQLGIPVVPTAASRGIGLDALIALIQNLPLRNAVRASGEASGNARANLNDASGILDFYKKATQVARLSTTQVGRPDTVSDAIDRWVLHPVFGPLILMAVLGLTFQMMFNFAELPMGWIESAFEWMGRWVKDQSTLSEDLKSFLVDGVIAGVGGTLVFLPQILILFALILFLEDFGFMARAVFLLDHWMGRFGLHGRSFLPLLSSFACAIPGMMGTRAIESVADRRVTLLTIPLMACSARIPVYTLLIAAFIPNTSVIGWIKLQGLVLFGLYALGLLAGLIVGALLKKFLLRGARPKLILELPSYKWPSFSTLYRSLLFRARLFVTRVGTIILALTILIWVAVSFPKSPEDSYASKVGHWIESAIRPMGFDWKIGMALIPSFAAREVMVSALSTAYAVELGEDNDSAPLGEVLKTQWSLATALSLLVWVVFAPQCISTIATARRELNSWRWTAFMVGYLMLLAYSMSALTFWLVSKMMNT